MSNLISISIVSDVVCPWCFVGKRRLERVIKQFQMEQPLTRFKITWLPYQLEPSAPLVPQPKEVVYGKKFGVSAKTKINSMIKTGKPEGINFSFNGLVGNTLLAHRLIHLGDIKGIQDQVMEGLFKAFFENEKDVFTIDGLSALAEDLGLESDQVKEYLSSNQDLEEVENMLFKSKSQGICAVPHFIFNDKLSLQGAQNHTQFLEMFNLLT